MDTQYSSYGIGLLATVTSLPSFHTYNTSSKAANETLPLDLSKKVAQLSAATSCSPLKKRYREEFTDEIESVPAKVIKTELTPNKPVCKSENAKKSVKVPPAVQKETKRTKVSRKLKFDEDNSSPVSGTIIRPLEEINGNVEHESGDIDPQYNIVEATDEARAEIAAIPNVIGDYRCKLCRIDFEDVFELARHRCSCIVLLEYRCPECGKKFNCPANLASHRRWHKPRDQAAKKDTSNDENQYPCTECGKSFKRMAYLKKHQATHLTKKTSTNKPRATTFATTSEDSKDSTYSSSSVKVQPNFNNNVYSAYSCGSTKSSSSMSDILFTAIHHSVDEDSSDSGDSQRLHIITDHRFTEDENIAAAALAHLRHGSSVIKHTTALAV